MPQFSPGDPIKVNGEKGRAEGHIVGIDPESGMYRVRYGAVEAKDDKGTKIEVEGRMGYAAPEQITKRRKS